MGWASYTQFRRLLTGKVAVISLFTCLSLVAFDAVELTLSRQERLAQAGREASNLAASLARYSQGVFLTADTALIGLRNEVSHYGTDGPHLAVIQGLMYQNLANVAALHGLFLFDANGHWLANTVPNTPADISYADRDYFQYHRSHPADVLLIGRPIRSRADNTSIITVTRRVYGADGRFGGVLDATVSTDFFQRFFAGFDIGAQGSITMVDDTGVILVRQPYNADYVGHSVASSPGFQMGQTLPDGESFSFLSSLDGHRRIGAYFRVEGTKLRIIVSRATSDILAPWWQEARINLFCLIFVLSAAIFLSRRIGVELRDRARAEQLYRLLADNSEDAIVCGDVFGRCRYTSPSLSIITTHSAEALRGWGWVDLVVEADRPKVITALTDLQSGASQASARYRYARADGAVTWVEMRARLTQLVPGISQREFVANIRDITRQKQAEEELEEANAELSALSMTDALTGVANRRQFDQMLRKEWNRAMRTASPLSLLMIDADHFKAYNDLYGHPMGDQCLRQVAQAVARSVLRAGDVVARYGGEEFAVILPDTIAEMAAQVGDRVIAALALDAVPHQGNARGIVTVSIGVASMIPELGSTSAELMSQADAALYQAKHAGRATIVIAPPSVTPPLPIPGQRNAA